MAPLPKISIKKGRDWQILRGHPWLFSGAISQAPGSLAPGSLVDLVDTQGRFVARGYYNPNCDIAVRVLSLSEDTIDKDFLAGRVKQSLALRARTINPAHTDAYRLINAEGDFLPGFIVDSYAGHLVVQSHTAGADALTEPMLGALADVARPKGIVLRNDASARKREAIEREPPRVVQGACPEEILVRENAMTFAVDVLKGQKTGFFTDQRDKRTALARYASALPAGGRMANLFSYTGAFSVYAAAANENIKTINVDESQRALDTARRNFDLNSLDCGAHEFVLGDAFKWLESQGEEGNQCDIVIVDPPAFAKSHKDKNKAIKAYARMVKLALTVASRGGLLVVCSCSGSVSLDELTDCVREACAQKRRPVQLLETLLNGADHPVSIMNPEGGYLKVLFLAV